MDVKKTLFMTVAHVLRALPRFRGKVRIGLAVYRFLHRENERWQTDVSLFSGSSRFTLTLESAHERMALLMDGYERETSEFLASMYEGGVILDIGANIGLIAIPLAQDLSHRGVEIFAFEPVRSNYEALRRHVSMNDLSDRISVIPFALGENDSTASIEVEAASKGFTGTANILPDSFEFDRTTIEVRSLDSLTADETIPADVGLMKIDTDGYDLYVLRGATRLLREARPIILAELNNHCLAWHGHSVRHVEEFLRPYDYSLYPAISRGRTLRFRRTLDESFKQDALLVPAEKRNRVEQYLID